MANEYLDIMIQSLQKKKKILDGIIEKNKEQREILEKEELNADDFERNVQAKSDLVDQIEILDEGFEELFGRVKTVVKAHKQEYREEIVLMQQLITEITEKSVTIQSEEMRNRRMVELRFSQERKKIREKKNTSVVANQYYKNMSNLNYVEAQFMDSKK